MSRTQDLALARLRVVAMRWQGGAVGDSAVPGDPPRGPGPAPTRDLENGQPDAWFDPAPGPQGHAEVARPGVRGPSGGMWVRLVGLLAVLVALGGGAAVVTSWPREMPAEVVVMSSAAPSAVDPFAGAGATPFAEPGAEPFAEPASAVPPEVSLLVHVAGDVKRPGVVRLPAGARVEDAVEAAGGLRRGADVGATNLARLVVDGERIEVGADQGQSQLAPSGSIGVPGAPIDLNTATAEQLDSLPGIGPVTAAKILAWRTANGRFTIVDELAEVPGIGPKTLAELRAHVRV